MPQPDFRRAPDVSILTVFQFSIYGVPEWRDRLGAWNGTEWDRLPQAVATGFVTPLPAVLCVDAPFFRRAVLRETGVAFCSRLHFGRPLVSEKDFYLRLAYSGIDISDIKEGLGKFKAYIEG